MELFENSSLVVGFAVLQYSLNDSASIWMSGQDVDLASESFNDELDMLGWDSLNGLLHNMISVLIFDTLQNVGLQFFDKFRLLICEDMLQGLDTN
jgi:hypothetical protein